jgi:UDP-galactopyranose mutase
VLLGGRLATYRYYDMHQVAAQALALADRELGQAGGVASAATPARPAA